MKKISKLLTGLTIMCSLVSCGSHKENNQNNVIALTNPNDVQLQFEEEYMSKKFSYGEGGKFAISIISSLGNIAAGCAFDSPTAIVGGVFSILTAINDQFNGNSGPTIADVMNKLAEMDTKLDGINDKLDKNYNQLSTEAIRTQAMVDTVLLEEQEKAIAAFNTDYVEKIGDYQRNFADYVEQSYKAYVEENRISDIYVEKINNEWSLVPVAENPSAYAKEIKIELVDFTNAKTFLEKNYNVVATGFMDRFAEDIENNIKATKLPEGMSTQTLRDFIGANIVENFTKKYYEENHDKALEIRNLAINFANQINGKATKSIADRYVSRMKYMFNFAGEMKKYSTGSLANLTHMLDVNSALAAQACLYAGVNQEELRTAHIAARETLKNYYEGVKELPDNYCFLTSCKLGGDFYRAHFNTYYTDDGNDCKFHSKFVLENIDINSGELFIKDDINKHNFVDQLDHTRIVTRMNLMRANGLVETDSYINYLRNANIIPEKAYQAYEYLHNIQWVSNDGLRFITNLTTRSMNNSDKNIEMSCSAKGNRKGDYFNTQWTGKYKGAHDEGCWSGNIAETTFIDAITGEVQTNKKVCAYATYAESHWYWSQDEYYAFVDNKAGNFFFGLERVA